MMTKQSLSAMLLTEDCFFVSYFWALTLVVKKGLVHVVLITPINCRSLFAGLWGLSACKVLLQ